MQLLSDVRLGIDLGLIEDKKGLALKELLVLQRPANLQLLTGKTLDVFERDRKSKTNEAIPGLVLYIFKEVQLMYMFLIFTRECKSIASPRRKQSFNHNVIGTEHILLGWCVKGRHCCQGTDFHGCGFEQNPDGNREMW